MKGSAIKQKLLIGTLVAPAMLFANGVTHADDSLPGDARAQIPPALIGTWKLDVTASKFPGNAPRAQFRTFDYTADGKLLVNFLGLSADGKQFAGHWAVQLDGTPGLEYTREDGPTPHNVITLRKIDNTTFDLTAARHGDVYLTGTFKLSPDGETLSWSYVVGSKEATYVYHRWNE